MKEKISTEKDISSTCWTWWKCGRGRVMVVMVVVVVVDFVQTQQAQDGGLEGTSFYALLASPVIIYSASLSTRTFPFMSKILASR